MEDKNIKTEDKPTDNTAGAAQTVAQDIYGGQGAKRNNGGRDNNNRGRGGKSFNRAERPKEEFEQRILEVARVTRVMAGGTRMQKKE